MYREELVKFKISCLIEDEAKYEYPEFIQLARKLHGVNRRSVAHDTGISHTHLFYLETGFFKKPPKKEIFLILATYYGIPEILLKEKAMKFISEDKNRWRGKNAIREREKQESDRTQHQGDGASGPFEGAKHRCRS